MRQALTGRAIASLVGLPFVEQGFAPGGERNIHATAVGNVRQEAAVHRVPEPAEVDLAEIGQNPDG